MSNRHLPAGQNIQGGPTGGVPGVDMPGGPGGPRRRQPPYGSQYHHQHQHQPQHQHQHQHMNPMYGGNYMQQQYSPQPFYGMPPYQSGQYANSQYPTGHYPNHYPNAQYPNGGVPSPGYNMPYGSYGRSPPSMHQYVPMNGVSVPSFPRPNPQSPALATPYQPPPAPAPIPPPHTPSSSHSSQAIPPPTPPTPQSQSQEPAPLVPVPAPVPAPAAAIVETPESVAAVVEPSEPEKVEEPFRPPLPWLSRPDLDFPIRTARLRRRRKLLNANSAPVSFPAERHGAPTEQAEGDEKEEGKPEMSTARVEDHSSPVQTATQSDGKDSVPTTPATPSTTVRSRAGTAASATPSGTAKVPMRLPSNSVPIIPALPKASTKDVKAARVEKASGETAPAVIPPDASSTDATTTAVKPDSPTSIAAPAPAPKPVPSSWANLFAKSSTGTGRVAAANGTAAGAGAVNGNGVDGTNGTSPALSKTNSSSVAEAIRAYRVDTNDKISFLEPRGLINTGNMCYMNSVLQVLMFCIPFYDFLNQISKRAVHSFKSETPLIDAMIMFMHEYKVIKSSASTESLRRVLKNEELERYGEPFTPEFVYEAIRQLSRFASMRRGHQQDAEEFLGFLLQSLDDECTAVMSTASQSQMPDGPGSPNTGREHADPSSDWLEVGRKQRAAVTRSSGSNTSTPITKIFGGLLRSEFRVPGLKDSITTEPYQPLQLDIGSPDVRNVVDALRGLTRPERLQGDFNSPRGKDVVATKQVFIESLPPVLILHLKRFQFDAEGNGTVKIWKKVGYPLELEIPREALSRQKRQALADGAMPKYKLISVVYHHGKNASGGHYTVDVRRQEGREWIRLDDTIIRRIRSEDVAEGGEEEGVKDNRKDGNATGSLSNRFGAINDEDAGDDDGWKQVTASAGGNKRWSSVVNGASPGSGSKGKQVKDSIKDNKVAYLLFYQRV